jgi:acetolactate synthase-1/2/3 large subunit
VVDEGGTSGHATTMGTRGAPPHDWLQLTGGSIGYALPTATGAAIACPDRRVLCLQGDGGGMYTVQALWTQAREKLDITTIIFSNRRYGILQVEFGRVGAHNPGPKAMSMLELTNPDLDWVKLGRGHGRARLACTDCRRIQSGPGGVLHRVRTVADRSGDLTSCLPCAVQPGAGAPCRASAF